MSDSLHPAPPNNIPSFITAPGETDVLMVVMGAVLVLAILMFGILFFRLHSLPERGLEGVTPGSSCVANAYSNNHDTIASKEASALRRVALHIVDALALVHALILRLQTLVFPFQTLVFSGH
jgi:hypothetical protein